MQTFILGGEAFLSGSNFQSNQAARSASRKPSVRNHTNDRLSDVQLPKLVAASSDSFDLSLRARFLLKSGREGYVHASRFFK